MFTSTVKHRKECVVSLGRLKAFLFNRRRTALCQTRHRSHGTAQIFADLSAGLAAFVTGKTLCSVGQHKLVAFFDRVDRGSFVDSFPLFGLKLEDYDSLFAEKLDLLLKIRENEHVHWSGKHRAALTGQGVYPRPVQNPLPIRLGVGGTPKSFARAGAHGLPLMVAIIGGENRRSPPPLRS